MSAPKPPGESLLDANGNVRNSWVLYFNQQAAYVKSSDAAQSSADAAQTTANTAATNATSALTQLSSINSAPSLWLAGDYKQSANNLGAGWLVCDGTEFLAATYPFLAAALSGITAPGAGAGTRKLPLLASAFDDAHPEPAGPPVMQWWVRAY